MIKKTLGIAMLALGLWSCAGDAQNNPGGDTAEHSADNPGINARIAKLLNHPVEAGFPRCMEPDGQVRGVKSGDWTSGFYPGILWMAYEYTGDDQYKSKAQEWTALMEKEKTNPTTHDMGFKMNCSFGNGYRITQNPFYKDILVESAKTLDGRFNEKVGCTRSWDFNKEEWSFPVIIDNMMNLELLFVATQLSGDSVYYQHAVSHALTTLANHFRADNSSFHVLDYDPETGEVRKKQTHQGYADHSSWARGQAWGLYGYTMCYRFTGDKRFLDQAIKIYNYISSNPELPADKIPYWDYHAPDLATQPRDASAASITASALYELGGYTKNENMFSFADEIMKSLGTETYLMGSQGNQPFFLKHSTGNWPKHDEIDVPIIYADYYYLEALLRKKQLEESAS